MSSSATRACDKTVCGHAVCPRSRFVGEPECTHCGKGEYLRDELEVGDPHTAGKSSRGKPEDGGCHCSGLPMLASQQKESRDARGNGPGGKTFKCIEDRRVFAEEGKQHFGCEDLTGAELKAPVFGNRTNQVQATIQPRCRSCLVDPVVVVVKKAKALEIKEHIQRRQTEAGR